MDHATLNHWVIDYSPLIAAEAKKRKRTAPSWQMDETYVKVKGQWVYLYRAVDKFGDTREPLKIAFFIILASLTH